MCNGLRTLVIFLLVLSAQRSALAADDNTAKHLSNRCGKIVANKSNAELMKTISTYDAGYCSAVIRVFLSLGPYLMPEMKYCPPDNIPLYGIAAFNQYLDAHPELQDEKFYPVIIQAFREKWPCK